VPEELLALGIELCAEVLSWEFARGGAGGRTPLGHRALRFEVDGRKRPSAGV
jgi:hypothetical protein